MKSVRQIAEHEESMKRGSGLAIQQFATPDQIALGMTVEVLINNFKLAAMSADGIKEFRQKLVALSATSFRDDKCAC